MTDPKLRCGHDVADMDWPMSSGESRCLRCVQIEDARKAGLLEDETATEVLQRRLVLCSSQKHGDCYYDSMGGKGCAACAALAAKPSPAKALGWVVVDSSGHSVRRIGSGDYINDAWRAAWACAVVSGETEEALQRWVAHRQADGYRCVQVCEAPHA